MDLKGKRVGLVMCASYCTLGSLLGEVKHIIDEGAEIIPIMSEHARIFDTRFGKADDFAEKIEQLTGRKIIYTMQEAEKIGHQDMTDVVLIAPCTGNTLAKIACGVTDSAVTMAAKAHMRNGRPVLIAVSTNDALGGNARNLGALLDRKNVYFVPFYQDDPGGKPASLIADFDAMEAAIDAALAGRQLQPLLETPPFS